MNLFGVMEVSGSALQAERIRAEVVAANMANAETTRTADGGPYRRQHVVFTSEAQEPGFASQMMAQSGSGGAGQMGGAGPMGAAIGGVQVSAVVADQGEPLKRFDPGHPDADKDGYVAYPDINPLTEMVDLMGATRAYGLNSSAVQAEKGMVAASLDIMK
ncbi:MAG TPA: flagellar basal body rod protein FlgC [Acidobacteriaceae bacterium]|jgi:flagellar basal-body rod protein FlgC|nr:flagellar basal body rod protein FlgC [Acidobacteriaceae bacterium]